MIPTFPRLLSGGLITTYACTSRCGHCLYRCGPWREKRHIDRATTEAVLRRVRELGPRSVHVGGGEPLLDPNTVAMVLEVAAGLDMSVEYVETNSSWFRDLESAREMLVSLKRRGLRTLLISISPFHAAHVPLAKVKGVLEACRLAGIGIFPWRMEFLADIEALAARGGWMSAMTGVEMSAKPGGETGGGTGVGKAGEARTYSLEDFEAAFGPGYLERVPDRYWVRLAGRALDTFGPLKPHWAAAEILARNLGGCRDLLATDHFHVDLDGNYIPGLCAGLAVCVEDLGRPLDPRRYPLVTTLAAEGVAGLLALAEREYGFVPSDQGYLGACDLCETLRRFLVIDAGVDSSELRPREFYQHA